MYICPSRSVMHAPGAMSPPVEKWRTGPMIGDLRPSKTSRVRG